MSWLGASNAVTFRSDHLVIGGLWRFLLVEAVIFKRWWWQCFEVAFWDSFLFCDVGSCRGPDSRACALNTTAGYVFFGLGKGDLWSRPGQNLIRCYPVVGAPACCHWLLGMSVRGCSHWYLSAFGFFRYSTVGGDILDFCHWKKQSAGWLWAYLFRGLRTSPLGIAVGKILLRFFCEKENLGPMFAIFF